MTTMQGRDGRRPGTFWIDNEAIDLYARQIGVHALAVYMVLVRHSNENVCFPSTATIADELGTSRPTISKAIHTLEVAGLIHIEERKLPVRGQTSHVYTILQVTKTAVKEIDSGVKEVYSGSLTAVNDVDGPCKPPLQGPVKEVYSHINNTKVNNTNLTPPPRARGDVGFGGGGGGDEGMGTDDEGNSPDDSQWEEADTANVQADLVDQLVRLGVRRAQAHQAVVTGTVTTDRDVVACKRYLAASTADAPAAVLWSQYLKLGQVPIAPQLDTSTVTDAQIAAARRMREESERKQKPPDDYVGLGRLAATLAGPALKPMPAPASAPVVYAERRFQR